MSRLRAIWRLVVAYRGAEFSGWQRQEGQRTVEQTLADALAHLTDEDVVLRAAGRTDAGVHARGQVVSVPMHSTVVPHKMGLALQAHLPDDVAVVSATLAPAHFDAKRHSIGKRYAYRVLDRSARDPFRGDTSWHVRGGLDLEAMRAAAIPLVGEKDYESFRSTRCDAAHARRFLWRVSVERDADEMITVEVRGNAFCRNMVRVIAGTLVDVGSGRIAPDTIGDILSALDRTRAGQTAPAKGLTMEEVYYPDHVEHAGIPQGAVFPGWPVSDEHWPPRPRPPRPPRPEDDA